MAKAIGIDNGKVIAASSDTAIDFSSANVSGITNLTISGDLVVNGDNVTIQGTNVQYEDTLLELGMEEDGNGGLQAPTSVTSKDVGLLFHIHDGNSASIGALYFDASAGDYRFEDGVSETTGVLSGGSLATLNVNVTGDLTGNADTATALATGRTLLVSLGSTSASTGFDGSSSINDIGVSGTLAVANGGTGATSAADARTNLDVDQAGTDNSTDVTLAASIQDVFSISTQDISAVDFGSDAFVGWDDSAGKLTYLAGLDTDTTLGGISAADNVVPSQLAVKTFVDGQVNAQAAVQGLGINSGAAIDPNKVIVLNGSGAAIAATDNSEPYILGIISNSTASSGQLVNVYKEGRVIEWPSSFGGSSPTIGDTLYLTTSAGLSTTAPTSGHVIRMGTIVTTGAGNKFFYKVEYVMSN